MESEGVKQAAKFMLVSARTAPKSGGVDDIVTAIVTGAEKEALATEMEKMAEERRISNFKRDAKNVRDSEAAVLIGVRGTRKSGLNCGGCGYANCDEFEKAKKTARPDFTGPTCIFKALDLSIALGSAAKRLNMLPEATVITGIPVSAKGKNIYFNRH